MTVMEITVLPVGTGSTSVSAAIAKAVKAAKEAGFDPRVSAMGTVVTGDTPALLSLASRMHAAVLAGGAKRVYTTIRIDERTDKQESLEERVAAVEEKAR